jgi:hypothetical protein
MNDITLSKKEIEYKATVIALEHFLSSIDTPETLEEIIRKFDEGFDDTIFDLCSVWEPFDSVSVDALYELISDLRNAVIYTLTSREPIDNNGGYTGFLTVGG